MLLSLQHVVKVKTDTKINLKIWLDCVLSYKVYTMLLRLQHVVKVTTCCKVKFTYSQSAILAIKFTMLLSLQHVVKFTTCC